MSQTFQIILLVLVIFSGYPIGKFIASKTKEELKDGRKWFKLIMLACVIGAIISVVFAGCSNLTLLLATFIFIFLLASASLKRI